MTWSMYRGLAKEGPWAVNLTLGSIRGLANIQGSNMGTNNTRGTAQSGANSALSRGLSTLY